MVNLTEYHNWLHLNQDSEKTISDYFKVVKRFFCAYREFSQEHVDKFLLNTLTQNSKNTFNQYRAALASYSRFSNQRIKYPKRKKIQQKEKPYITEKEMLTISNDIEYIYKKWPRYMVIFRFMFYTGLRLQEILNLKRNNIDLEKKLIVIEETKNYQSRVIPIYPKLAKDLDWYFKFENETSNCFNLDKSGIRVLFKNLNEQTNPSAHLHPHLMRRSCAQWYYTKTKDIVIVQKILGHTDIKTTMNYLGINTEKLIATVEEIFQKEKK